MINILKWYFIILITFIKFLRVYLYKNYFKNIQKLLLIFIQLKQIQIFN